MAHTPPMKLLVASGALLVVLLALLPPPASASAPQHHRRLAGHHDNNKQRRLQLQDSSFKPCAINSNPAGPLFYNASVTCLELHPAPSAPIQVPDDTSTVKWGLLELQTSVPTTAVFKDRNGVAYNISQDVEIPDDFSDYMTSTPLLIVKATLSAQTGNVTALSPEVYVPFSAIMASYKDTQFEATLFNSPPRPAGPNETSWTRWTLSSVVTVDPENPTGKYGTLLMGTFDNLFRAVRDSKGACRPALCSDPTFQSAACRYYTSFFGNSTNAMTLNWDPNMHFAADSELVPIFPAMRRQYMASSFQLYNLLKPYAFTPRKHVFLAHGTPMGIPQNFTGTLTKATTKLEYC